MPANRLLPPHRLMHRGFRAAGLVAFLVCFSTLAFGQVSRLSSQLDQLLDDPLLATSTWGVKVVSQDSGEVLYERNPRLLLVPASNMKLVTAVAAGQRLGLDYRFRTVLQTSGEMRKSTLRGDLIVVGGADPTLGARINSMDSEKLEKGNPWAVFDSWAEQLKSLGIRTIQGDLVGDSSLLAPAEPGSGWAWDDLPWGYASPAAGLLFNENLILVHIKSEEPNTPPFVELLPQGVGPRIVANLETGGFGETQEIELQRTDCAGSTFVTGRVKPRFEQWRSVSAPDPTGYFLQALGRSLGRAGVRVRGRIRQAAGGVRPGVLSPSAPPSADSTPDPRTLLVHQSPDLRYVLRVFLKTSHNLYGEVLLRMLSNEVSAKTEEAGIEQVKAVMTLAGVDPGTYFMADGSGLSRYNLLSAEAVVRLLQFASRQSYATDFLLALPVAGQDGTLKERMVGTAAAGRVRAKTGSLRHVRSLSGYATTADGETLVFSIIANNFRSDLVSAESVIDRIAEALASFSRQPVAND